MVARDDVWVVEIGCTLGLHLNMSKRSVSGLIQASITEPINLEEACVDSHAPDPSSRLMTSKCESYARLLFSCSIFVGKPFTWE